MSTSISNRRTVKGTAFRTCEYCGRHRTDRENRAFNYQYIDEQTQDWDDNVYCSKECRKAWLTENACADKIRRAGL